MREIIGRAGRFLQDARQQAIQEHDAAVFEEGFMNAASISLYRIQKRIDGFKKQMKDSSLSKTEQLMLVQLEEIKSEIEKEFDQFCSGTGMDWRPPTGD